MTHLRVEEQADWISEITNREAWTKKKAHHFPINITYKTKRQQRAMRNLSGTRGSYIARNLPRRRPYFLIWESAIFSCNLDTLAPLNTWSNTRQQQLATVSIHFCRQSCQILLSPISKAKGLICTQVTRQSVQPVGTPAEPPRTVCSITRAWVYPLTDTIGRTD